MLLVIIELTASLLTVPLSEAPVRAGELASARAIRRPVATFVASSAEPCMPSCLHSHALDRLHALCV